MRQVWLIAVVVLAACKPAVGVQGPTVDAALADAEVEGGDATDSAAREGGTDASAPGASDADAGWVDVALPTACTPGGCDDGNPCTNDVCDMASACTHENNTAPCDASGACTVDVCKGGSCVTGPGKLFSATYGGVGYEYAKAVTAMADGGLALAGFAEAVPLPGGKKSASNKDFWLVRTDAGGNLLWSQTYGGAGWEEASAVTALADGGLALAGFTQSTDLPGGKKSAGWSDFWLVRTDAAGKLLWNQTYGGAQSVEGAFSVSELADGGVALAGFGVVNTSDDYVWLVRTDADGELLWSQTYGGWKNDDAAAMIALADGGLALAGATNSIDLPGGQKSAGGYDMLLVRTDANGTLLWNQTYGGSGNDEAFAVTALADGGLALAGFTNSSDLPGGQTTAGDYDFWVVRTDAAGKLLWNKTFGGPFRDEAFGLTSLADGGLVLAGTKESSDEPGGKQDCWLVRTDAGGNPLWNRTYGGSGYDAILAVAALSDGGLALAGTTASTDLPGGPKVAGLLDGWLLRTDPWGHISCAEAGPCASKTLADCDDAKPCTADLCDGKTGCTHTNLTNGSACGGGKSCTAGVCGP